MPKTRTQEEQNLIEAVEAVHPERWYEVHLAKDGQHLPSYSDPCPICLELGGTQDEIERTFKKFPKGPGPRRLMIGGQKFNHRSGFLSLFPFFIGHQLWLL